MEAADSRLGSYAWKSILRGKDIIQRGARWRVGSGENINICQHRWLPRKHPPQFPICPIDNFANSTVDCLIDQTMRQWRANLVDSLFVVEDVEIIKAILLSRVVTKDVQFWPYTSNGVYSCNGV